MRAPEASALANVMILLQNATLRPARRSGHRLTFEEANPNMLLPLVTMTTFDVILMLRESADGPGGALAFTSRISSAPGPSIACFETSSRCSNTW